MTRAVHRAANQRRIRNERVRRSVLRGHNQAARQWRAMHAAFLSPEHGQIASDGSLIRRIEQTFEEGGSFRSPVRCCQRLCLY